ncbi:MAG TPA: DUF1499 domain-containing protein [Xanthobacteraceae bacterium]|nr:DUF1499 domain-containing protein [Xanthobacteraceae bacterium]
MIRRRLYTEVRISRLAVLSRRIAIFSLPVVLLAVALHRFGLVEYTVGFATLAAGLGVAVVAGLCALAAFVVIWNEGPRGLDRAIAACVIALLVLGYPAIELMRGATQPAISDITTDAADPPRFQAVALARPRGANAVAYPGIAAATLQRVAYPGIKPIEIDASADEAYNIMLSIVERRGWRVLDSLPPRGAERDGRIEAVAQTLIMGFREDVVIRVRAVERGVRVDMRSASRYGSHDLGSNARRIESTFAEFADTRRRGR